MNRYLYRRMNRGFRRVKFRAAGSIVLVMVAVATYVSMDSMMPSTAVNLQNKVKELALSDYIVHVASADELFTANLSSLPGVAAVEYRLTIQSRISYMDGGTAQSYSATLIGIEPHRMPFVNKLEMRDGDGHYFTGNGSGTALLEKSFALSKGFATGGTVSVQTAAGYVDVTVIGRAFSPEYMFMPINPQSVIPLPGTLAVVYLPIQWLRTSFGFQSGYVNEFTMLFDEGGDQGAIRMAVDSALAPAVVVYSIPKDQIYGYALATESLTAKAGSTGAIAFMILLVAFFVVYSSFARIVQEQRREIGVLRALGYSRASVLGSYLYMAVLLGLVGSVIGIIISFPIGLGLTNFYVDMLVHTNATSFTMSGNSAVAGLIFGPLTAIIACGIAVWGTVSMEPQAAIKGLHHKAGRLKTPKERTRGARGGARRLSYITLYTYRNVSRHKSRTALTVIAISFAIVLGSMPLLILASFSNSMTESVRDYEHWDLVVDYAYPLNATTAGTIPPQYVVETVQISKMVKEWHSGDASGMAVAIGIDMNQTLHAFNIADGRVAHGPGEMMVGYSLAKDNGIAVGDQIQVETVSGSATLSVTAVVNDMLGQLFVDLPAAEQMAGVLMFSGMYVKTADGRAADVRAALFSDPLVADVEYKDALRSGLLDLMSSYTAFLYVFALFGVMISTITIANIVFVGILERYCEYGQLRAVGYSRRDVSKSILMEIILIISISAVVAIPLSYATVAGLAGVYKDIWPIYRTTLYLGDWLGYVIVVAMTFGFGLLAAVPGIRFVSRMDVARTVTGGQFG